MSVTANERLLSRRDDVFMTTYARPPLALVRGQGSTVYDADGREYLDLIAGIAVCLLGHGHPKVIEAVTGQLTTLGHTSNLYATEPAVGLAEKLLGLLGSSGGGGRIFFCNSGAEANEAAIKIARRTGRLEIIAAEGSFHGRTMGALSITGQPAKRAPFEPLLPGVRFVPYGDAEALRAAVSRETAAVFLEPTLGEGGVVPPPAGYLQAARKACDEAGALLVMDEVQSVGRTGTWYAHQQAGIVPDVVTLAKGLAGGLPIGACIGLGSAAGLLQPGDHGSTFGGNPVVCAAALAVIDVIESEGLIAQAAEVGAQLSAGLTSCGAALLSGVRGTGLWLAMILAEPVAAVAERAFRDAGFLVNTVAPNTLRLAPPLVLTAAEAERFVAAVPGVLEKAQKIAKVTP